MRITLATLESTETPRIQSNPISTRTIHFLEILFSHSNRTRIFSTTAPCRSESSSPQRSKQTTEATLFDFLSFESIELVDRRIPYQLAQWSPVHKEVE